MEDLINHPSHYEKACAKVEPIVLCEQLDFCLGNFVKYVLRADFKGHRKQDLEKARYYLLRAMANGIPDNVLRLKNLAYAYENPILTSFFKCLENRGKDGLEPFVTCLSVAIKRCKDDE